MATSLKEAPAAVRNCNGFNTITGDKNVLYLLARKAGHVASVELLEKAGLRPLLAEEALLALETDDRLRKLLVEKVRDAWFYLGGDHVSASGMFTIDGRGRLVEHEEQQAYAARIDTIGGTRPPALFVGPSSPNTGNLYILSSMCDPDNAAPAVVGVPKDWKPFEIARACIRA